MPDGLTLAELGLVAVVLAALIPVIWLVARRRWLATSGWVFDCSLRRLPVSGAVGWMVGVARLNGELLEWYRVFSVSLRPKVVLRRGQVYVVNTRQPRPEEQSLLSNTERVAVLSGSDDVELALAPDQMTALLSWLESAPPGSSYG